IICPLLNSEMSPVMLCGSQANMVHNGIINWVLDPSISCATLAHVHHLCKRLFRAFVHIFPVQSSYWDLTKAWKPQRNVRQLVNLRNFIKKTL
uniref:Uncharacterized protein n=1 Tax=Paramormyrops kingsleyae TaxID=1676925 RepID=A0A3B3S7E1_9TELE